MADIVNLRQARKRRARADKDRQAAENRTRHGRTAGEKERDADAEQRARRLLDGHRIEDGQPAPFRRP